MDDSTVSVATLYRVSSVNPHRIIGTNVEPPSLYVESYLTLKHDRTTNSNTGPTLPNAKLLTYKSQ